MILIWQISTEIWFRMDKSADGRTEWTDGCTDDAKYIPLTSSVDNKQAKSNGNIDKKKKKKKINSSSKIIRIE